MKIKSIALLLLLSFAFASVRADSDGYFCIGKDYIAYQFNGISVPEPGHRLSVIYLGGKVGISDPVNLRLDDFQVHGMKCEIGRVEILAWDKHVTVKLDSSGPLVLESVRDRKAGDAVPGFHFKQFGKSRQGWHD